MKTKYLTILALLIVSFAAIFAWNQNIFSGIQQTEEPTDFKTDTAFSPDTEYATNTFASAEELQSFLQTTQRDQGRRYLSSGAAADGVAVPETASRDTVKTERSTTSSDDYSKTNVQEAGIDEADIFKTDGEYIYTISQNVLFIVKAYPGEDAHVVSKLNLSGRPESLFIKDNKLVVFGNAIPHETFAPFPDYSNEQMSFVHIYDIEQKQEPVLLKEYTVEGNYFEGRMDKGTIYLLMRSSPDISRPVPMPIIMEGSVKRTIPVERIHYYPLPYSNPTFVNIYALDIDSPQQELKGSSIAVEGSPTVYMSNGHLYLTTTERINQYELEKDIRIDVLKEYLTQEDKQLIEKIEDVESDILSRSEKEQKIMDIYLKRASTLPREEQESIVDTVEKRLKEKLDSYEHMEYTLIHKFSLDGTNVTPTADGKVPGHVNNQFALDENDNILRIATTISPRWNRFEKERSVTTNNVYTLSEKLSIIDSLEGLAKDESIYATRFINDRLYMVTFKQVDPFFVIGLKDPENIKNLGSLKIPGFSRYLHPYDDETIIGIGQDATETGRTKGLKIALYDVSDVTSPQEKALYVTDERFARSNALYEHKAFLFSKEKHLMVIPVQNYDYEEKGNSYNGAFVFNITEDTIALRGLIDHSGGANNNSYWQTSVERSAYIDNLLYTKSEQLLRINAIDTLEGVSNVTLDYSTLSIPVY